MAKPRDFSCPACGELVPGGAKSCPECGACERSGWSEDADADGLDLDDPDGKFDYDRFVEDEFGGGAKPRGIGRLWAIAAAVLLAALLIPLLRSCSA
jgi:hypothetical protein